MSILVFGRRRYAMKFSTSATIESFSLGSERATMSVIAASALPSTRSLSPSLRTPFLSRKCMKSAAAERLLPSKNGGI